MHELAIADAIATIADRHARGRRVTCVHVRIGHLRQVVPSALEFSFEVVAQGTVLQGAALAVDHVPAIARCRGCGWQGPLDEIPFVCRRCLGPDLKFLQGDELSVESLELEEVSAG